MDPRRLPPDFREFLECLNAAGVEYLLVGGHAVTFHGYPRVTADMDVWIGRSVDNADRLLAAIRRFFSGDLPGLTREQLLDPDQVTHFGAHPFQIEILNRISGAEFPAAWSRRIQTHYDSTPVNILSLEDLKLNKRASGRAKDLADLENLPE